MKLMLTNEGTSSLNEDSQAVELRFSLGFRESNGTLVNLMPWVLCRDYFNDVIYVQKSGDRDQFYQYGFYWDYHEELNRQWRTGPAYLLLTCTNTKVLDTIYNNRRVLRSLDVKAGFKRTIAAKEKDFDVDGSIGQYHGKYILVLKIDSQWLHNSVMMSLYTLIVRMLGVADYKSNYVDYKHFIYTMYTSMGFAEDNADWGLIRDVLKNPWHLDLLLENHTKIFSGGGVPYSRSQHEENADDWDEFENNIHNNSGIQSFFHGLNYPTQDPSNTLHPFVVEARFVMYAKKEEYYVEHHDFG